MAVTEKWLKDTEEFANAQGLHGDAVMFLQARLKRLLKEYRDLQTAHATTEGA